MCNVQCANAQCAHANVQCEMWQCAMWQFALCNVAMCLCVCVCARGARKKNGDDVRRRERTTGGQDTNLEAGEPSTALEQSRTFTDKLLHLRAFAGHNAQNSKNDGTRSRMISIVILLSFFASI